MDRLNKARELFSKVHVNELTNELFKPVVVTAHPDFTVTISPNTGEDRDYPYVEIIKNDDLLRLLDYAERRLEGDESLDDFIGVMGSIVFDEDTLHAHFMDMFFSLSFTPSGSGNCFNHIDDIETYLKKQA